MGESIYQFKQGTDERAERKQGQNKHENIALCERQGFEPRGARVTPKAAGELSAVHSPVAVVEREEYFR